MTLFNYTENATILIVDDTPTNLNVLVDTISSLGWETLIATDGESAIEQAEYAQPDLILLDVMMPGMDGFETCVELKKNPATQEIPVIFLTALTDQFNKVLGLSKGGVDYLTKPCNIDEVLAKVNIHLEIRSLTKKLELQNQKLEEIVEERTKELSIALEQLREFQLHLVQKEKLSALGELVTGVAHEINNPLNFVTGYLYFLERHLNDLIQYLKVYYQHYPNLAREVNQNIKLSELDQIFEEVPRFMSSINLGMNRIRGISDNLRYFTRLDTSDKTLVNIHEGIDGTLMILSHRLQRNQFRSPIEVIKNYGNLPLVECYPEQMNQVFMNIIANAIDAIDESSERLAELNQDNSKNHQIVINTVLKKKDNLVIVKIKDSGSGIALEIQPKIFEQFFTTKPREKGTGLGLSISRQIIEDNHRGKLRYNSELETGAEFIVEIPFDCAMNNSKIDMSNIAVEPQLTDLLLSQNY